MSTPANADTQTDNAKSDSATKETFSDRVDTAIKAVTTDKDSGKQVFPDGTPEEVVYAANAELRRRTTQSSFTKAQQELKQKEAELNTVKQFTTPVPKVELTPEQQEELDDLKLVNPDAWRVKVNALENEAILTAEKQHQDTLNEALVANELVRRTAILETFRTSNPELNLTDSVIDNDVPPRYKQRLDNGEVTFEQFLDNVKEYLSQGKVVQSEVLNNQPNLSKVGGSAKPSEQSVELDDAQSYENEVY